MTATDERQLADGRLATLVMALELGAAGDAGLVNELYTEDVIGWSPTVGISSREELKEDYSRRAGAFSEVGILIDPIDVVEDRGYAEWVMSATHVGPFAVDACTTMDPTGRRITLRGVTIARFDGMLIRSFHQYWDNYALLVGLGRNQDAE
jgi:hypothetical protein